MPFLRPALRAFSQEAGLRFLARRKAASAVAILTMALALGANTAVFSVVKAFVLASIAVPEPDRLIVVTPARALTGRGIVAFSEAYPNYLLLKSTQHAFADVACVLQAAVSWDDNGEARPLQASRVTASFFKTVRVLPILGSAFTEKEEGPSPAPVVVISHALWTSGFNSDSTVIGRVIRIDGFPVTVIGVMPPGFQQPIPTDIWAPFDIPPQMRVAITGARQLTVLGRIKDGLPTSAALAEAKAFEKRALEANSVDNKDFTYQANSLRQTLLNGADNTLLLVQIGAIVLLLLAVLNLASLLVAWGFDRRQEMAVRQALGAANGRVIRMLFLQSIVVVAMGAALGLGMAWLLVPWVRGIDLGPGFAYFVSRIDLDGTVLAASAAVALAAGLIAGVLPAWFNRNADLTDALRSGSRSATLSPAALKWQQGMVVAQAALSVVILAAAALIGVSFRNLGNVHPGFDTGNAIVARLQLQDGTYATAEKRIAFSNALLENLSHEAAIASFGFTSTLPVGDQVWGGRFFVDQPGGGSLADPMLLHIRRASWNYLTTMGIPVVSGRGFDAHDDATNAPVAIISHTLAARLWPDGSALGRQIMRAIPGGKPTPPFEIVGVAGDVMDAGFNFPASETIYVPYPQWSVVRLSVVVHPRAGRAEALTALRRAIHNADPVPAANNVATLSELVAQANALPRLQAALLLIFATVAIGIAALGSYGVMSQVVANREREYALRLVFGAQPFALGRSVCMHMARLTIPGIITGLAAALMLGGAMKQFVFGIEPRSPVVLGIVSVAMACVALVAALPSALRAMRVDVRTTIG